MASYKRENCGFIDFLKNVNIELIFNFSDLYFYFFSVDIVVDNIHNFIIHLVLQYIPNRFEITTLIILLKIRKSNDLKDFCGFSFIFKVYHRECVVKILCTKVTWNNLFVLCNYFTNLM